MNNITPYNIIGNNTLYCGDSALVLKHILDNIIDLTITSPPYDNLRIYNGFSFDFKSIAKSLYRITKQGGIVVWVVNDATINGSETGTSFRQALFFMECGFNLHDTMIYEKNTSTFPASSKSLRYTQIFEYMFVFSKGKPKTVNLLCDKKNKWGGVTTWGNSWNRDKDDKLVKTDHKVSIPLYSPRNNIWTYKVGRGAEKGKGGVKEHPAVFPKQLVKDHILTWSNENDLILDPFMGSGTTAIMAKETNRKCIGVEISQTYCDLIINNLKQQEELLF